MKIRKTVAVLMALVIAAMAIECAAKSNETKKQEETMETITIEMSDKTKAMTEQVGEQLGSMYFREDLFETMMRPSYDTREANSEMPTDSNGKALVFSTPMTETLVGKNHVYK